MPAYIEPDIPIPTVNFDEVPQIQEIPISKPEPPPAPPPKPKSPEIQHRVAQPVFSMPTPAPDPDPEPAVVKTLRTSKSIVNAVEFEVDDLPAPSPVINITR